MLLSILLLVLLAGIAYFHYAQGLFSATVSAVCAAVAALMAFSYHETIVANYTGGALAAYGNAVVLVGLFALIYLVLRIVIDNFMPGNVRYPLILDRVGSGAMGLVAGILGTAVIAIAAQQLPFGTTAMGYSPYPLETMDNNVSRAHAAFYRINPGEGVLFHNEVQVERFDTEEAEEARQGLWVPVDEWFVGLVAHLSDNGSLAGNNFRHIYPDYKTAIYAQQLGMQRAAQQYALNQPGREDVNVTALFRVTTEGEGAQFPEGLMQVPGEAGQGREDVSRSLRPAPGKTLLVARLRFERGAQDTGGLVRFSPGTSRLVIAGEQYFPIASLESGTVAVAHRPDDYLMAANGVDFIYEVDAAAVGETGLAEPAFLEFKRFARVDLSDTPIYDQVTKSPHTHVQRKIPIIEFISSRLLNREIGGEQRSRNEFNQLRASVPAEEEDPRPAPPAQDEDAGNEGGALDRLREGVGDRNELIEGGGDGGD